MNSVDRAVLFFFLITLGFFSVALSQEVQVNYKARYLGEDFTDRGAILKSGNIKAEFVDRYINYLKRFKQDLENQEIILRTSGENGFILRLPEPLGSETETINVIPVSLQLFNKVYSLNDSLVIGVDDKSEFAVSFDSSEVTYTITPEIKYILGFKCFKANISYKSTLKHQFARSHVEVWFTPEINKNGGPILYTNLPGLILEVKLREALITASDISNIRNVRIVESNKKIITEDQFHKYVSSVSESIRARNPRN